MNISIPTPHKPGSLWPVKIPHSGHRVSRMNIVRMASTEKNAILAQKLWNMLERNGDHIPRSNQRKKRKARAQSRMNGKRRASV